MSAYYLVIRSTNWSSTNTSGVRAIASTSTENARHQISTITPASGGNTFQQFITIERFNVGQTIECYAFQNSGNDMDTFPFIYAIILKRI